MAAGFRLLFSLHSLHVSPSLSLSLAPLASLSIPPGPHVFPRFSISPACPLSLSVSLFLSDLRIDCLCFLLSFSLLLTRPQPSSLCLSLAHFPSFVSSSLLCAFSFCLVFSRFSSCRFLSPSPFISTLYRFCSPIFFSELRLTSFFLSLPSPFISLLLSVPVFLFSLTSFISPYLHVFES